MKYIKTFKVKLKNSLRPCRVLIYFSSRSNFIGLYRCRLSINSGFLSISSAALLWTFWFGGFTPVWWFTLRCIRLSAWIHLTIWSVLISFVAVLGGGKFEGFFFFNAEVDLSPNGILGLIKKKEWLRFRPLHSTDFLYSLSIFFTTFISLYKFFLISNKISTFSIMRNYSDIHKFFFHFLNDLSLFINHLMLLL